MVEHRPTYLVPAEDHQTWRIDQMLIDPDNHNDWTARFQLDVPASRTARAPILHLLHLAPLAN